MATRSRRRKPEPERIDHIPVKAGDTVDPSPYNNVSRNLYFIAVPCVVQEVNHEGYDWTTFLVDTTAGPKWINHRFFIYPK